MRVPRIVRALAVVAAIGTLAPSARATECKADVRATPGVDQITDEVVTKVFLVEVDTQEACATVYVDATITERLFNGEEIRSTRRGSRKVSNHASTQKVNLRIARDSTLVDTSFKVARCVVCGTE